MFTLADLPRRIPLFPLMGAVLLPRARLPLQIFEPRYLAMLDDTLKRSDRMIGMIQPLPEHQDTGTPALRAVGCAGRVTSFTETPDGRYRITITGISRFRVTDLEEGFSPYIRAAVNWDGFPADLGGHETDPGLERDRFFPLLGSYFDAVGVKTDLGTLRAADDEMLINSLSMLCPFEAEEKQALLEAQTLPERRLTLETLMEFALRGGEEEGRLQ